jgi:hypothetical protein
MAAAIVEVCVDPRLNHELVRIQVRQKLARLGLAADRIYVLNENGDSLGSNFRNTVKLLRLRGEPLAFCAVLHHDDCLAAQAGLRPELAESAERIASYLAGQGLPCPVLTGEIRTANNHLRWSDDPPSTYQPFSFGQLDV